MLNMSLRFMPILLILHVYTLYPSTLCLNIIFQFLTGGWLNGYSLGCQDVDYSNSPKALTVSINYHPLKPPPHPPNPLLPHHVQLSPLSGWICAKKRMSQSWYKCIQILIHSDLCFFFRTICLLSCTCI